MTVLEKAAAAAWAVAHPDAPWDSAAGPSLVERKSVFAQARAVIETLMEPSDAMLIKSLSAIQWINSETYMKASLGTHEDWRRLQKMKMRLRYQAMLRAVLDDAYQPKEAPAP